MTYEAPGASFYDPTSVALGDVNSDGLVDIVQAADVYGLVVMYQHRSRP